MTPHLEQRIMEIAARECYEPASEYVHAMRLAVEAAIADNIPEGCTPADANVLREANHRLTNDFFNTLQKLKAADDEREALRSRVAKLNSICGRFSNIAYNIHQLDWPVSQNDKQALKDLQVEYDELQKANQIEAGK